MNASLTKTCSCFGHREIEITENLRNEVKSIYENLIENEGFEIFYFGGFSMFDNLCWQVVSALKKENPKIQRIFCLTDERHLRLSKRPFYLKDDDFEDFIYFELKYDFYKKRLYYRNIEMIKQSDFILFYVTTTERSGAYKALKFAEKSKKRFINLGKI